MCALAAGPNGAKGKGNFLGVSLCAVSRCGLWAHSDVSLHVGAQLHLAEAAEARRARRLARDPAAVCTIWAGYPETRLQVRVSR